MLDKHTHTLIAQRLNQAEKQREQIRAISLDHPTITIEDAYAVQREWVNMKIAEGRVLKGHKIGLTSKAMQASSQDGSSGQSSSQQSIAAMAISFVSAEAGCDVAETSTATVRIKARKRRRTACIIGLCWIWVARSSRITVSDTQSPKRIFPPLGALVSIWEGC